jgi:EmrB/QacA subfamily drug resistance transporter
MTAHGTTTRKWWTLAAACVATFMLLLDITVVNTAMAALEEDLGASFTDLQWVVDAYTVTLAALVLTAGSLADRLGRRRLFTAGLGVFSAASLLAGLAPDPTVLNLGRAVQGVGGAILFAVSLALLAEEFPGGRERGAAMSVYGATIGVAMASGPLVGGALTGWLGWESVFLVNVPIGAAAMIVTRVKLRESRDPGATRVDWVGLTLFSGALFLLVLGLLCGNDVGWASAPIVALLAGTAVLLAAFVAVERAVAQPMLPLELFKRRSFTGVQLAAFAVPATTSALSLYLMLFLQNYLGLSPLQAGICYLPVMITALAVTPISGWLLSRIRAGTLIAAGITLAGTGLLLMSGLDARADSIHFLAGFVVHGAGIGLVQPAIGHVAMSVAPQARGGMAAGINNTFRMLGATVGIAGWGAIFIGHGSRRASQLAEGNPDVAGERSRVLVEAAASGNLDTTLAGLPPTTRDTAATAAREGILAGLNHILALGTGLAVVAAAIAFWLLRDHTTGERRIHPNPPQPSCRYAVPRPPRGASAVARRAAGRVARGGR